MAFHELFERAVIPGAGQSHKPNIFSVFWSAAGRAGFEAGHVRQKRGRLGGQG
jgi:hypothetical protein